jgi:hypothetical protein
VRAVANGLEALQALRDELFVAPSTTPVAWVGDLGEVAEQVTALVGCQCGGRVQPLGSDRDGG